MLLENDHKTAQTNSKVLLQNSAVMADSDSESETRKKKKRPLPENEDT